MTDRKTRTRPRGHSVRATQLVSQLKRELNELKKKLLLIGYITDRLDRKAESVYLVGGQAVETYTAGQFTTGDIDVTTTDRKETEKVLGQIGFKKHGMVWLNEALGVAVHIVGSYPTRSDRTRTIHVGPYKVRVVGIEDLIIDRLVAAKFWKSQRDAEQANALFNAFRKRIDAHYIRARARQERVEEILEITVKRPELSKKPRLFWADS